MQFGAGESESKQGVGTITCRAPASQAGHASAAQVMDSSEKKAQLLKTLVMVTTGACARYTDPAILMEILFIVKGLIVDGSAGPSAQLLEASTPLLCPCLALTESEPAWRTDIDEASEMLCWEVAVLLSTWNFLHAQSHASGWLLPE